MSMTLEAVRKEVVVPVDPARAFEAFTAEIATWWPLASHSVGGDDAVGVSIDPRVGGLVAEATRAGERHVWGVVRLWDPPRRAVMSWHPGHQASDPTEVEVSFEPTPDGTRVILEHRGLTASWWPGERASYDSGWPPVLERFAAAMGSDAPGGRS